MGYSLLAIGIIVDGFKHKFSYGIIAPFFFVLFIIFSKAAWICGDWFRKFVMPDLYFTNGIGDAFNKRIYWMVGPQSTALLVTAVVCGLYPYLLIDTNKTSDSKSEISKTVDRQSSQKAPNKNGELGSPRANHGGENKRLEVLAPAPAPVFNAPLTKKTTTPSFNCDDAITYAEVIICQHEDLAKRDRVLAQIYRNALTTSGNKQLLRSMLNNWRKNERDKCKNPECIAAAYDQIIIELTAD